MTTQIPAVEVWPRQILTGPARISVYRKRRCDHRISYEVYFRKYGRAYRESYPTEAAAMARASELMVAAMGHQHEALSLTPRQALEYVQAVDVLPERVPLLKAVECYAEAVQIVGSENVVAACREWKARRTVRIASPADILAELLEVKRSRGCSAVYLADLKFRLGRFANGLTVGLHEVTTADVQGWLDDGAGRATGDATARGSATRGSAARGSAARGSAARGSASYDNYRRALHTLFEFAKARGYVVENPVAKVERVKPNEGETTVYTPDEFNALLAVGGPALPVIAIGGLAGLRMAEIRRMNWSDYNGVIVVGKDQAKTKMRRVVPVCDRLKGLLTPGEGFVWPGSVGELYAEFKRVATAAKIAWKPNALRHSYASYRFALTGDAGKVAGEMGNTPDVVHRHYRALVTEADAKRWFAVG